MEDVTDASFRILCREQGAAMVYTEFVPSDGLIRDAVKAKAKMRTIPEEAQEAARGSTITAKELKEKMDRGEDFFLVDVREKNEYEIVNIPGAVLIPKGEFLTGEAFAKLPQDKQIILHCKSGGRSAEALAAVKKAGFSDAVHVGGGILSWIETVDPSLPKY